MLAQLHNRRTTPKLDDDATDTLASVLGERKEVIAPVAMPAPPSDKAKAALAGEGEKGI